MARAPDWLLNEMNSASNLIEDSPKYRAEQEKTQRDNLTKVTNQALGQLEDRTVAAQQQAVQAGQQALDAMTPFPTPLAGPDFDTQVAPPPVDPGYDGVPTANDFSSAPQVDPQITPPALMPDSGAQELNPQGIPAESVEDVVTKLAQASGLSPQVVASMALIGKEISKIEAKQGQSPPPPTTSGPMPPGQTQPQPMPMPPSLSGPSLEQPEAPLPQQTLPTPPPTPLQPPPPATPQPQPSPLNPEPPIV